MRRKAYRRRSSVGVMCLSHVASSILGVKYTVLNAVLCVLLLVPPEQYRRTGRLTSSPGEGAAASRKQRSGLLPRQGERKQVGLGVGAGWVTL